MPIRDIVREPAAGKRTYHQALTGEEARGISRWRPSDGKGKVVGLYICTMRRYAPLQYRQVLLRAPTAALYYISSPTTASTFALACCDDFCQRRAKLYLTYCKRAFGKPQSGKSAQQARANAYFFRRSVACIGNSSAGPLTPTNALRRPFQRSSAPTFHTTLICNCQEKFPPFLRHRKTEFFEKSSTEWLHCLFLYDIIIK